mmetsp:Transcript_55747/g.130067  ORF Transcript_55747/g.130067 Transcript_55747/m.130067 type:complete len:384 (-) Transcript_55747:50-1201(-)
MAMSLNLPPLLHSQPPRGIIFDGHRFALRRCHVANLQRPVRLAMQATQKIPQDAPSPSLGSSVLPALFVFAAVANRVSNRVLLAPLQQHTYFLALTTTVAQLLTYVTWLWQRCLQGLVTKPMWNFAVSNPFLLAAFGACEAAFFPLVFYSAARLPGGLIQVLNQTLIPFTVLFSFVFLRRRYDIIQILGVVVVLGGVLLFTSLPQCYGVSMVFAGMCIAAYGLQAAALVVKEAVFTKFARACKEQGETQHSFDAALFLAIGTLSRCLLQLLLWPTFLQLTTDLSVRTSAANGVLAMLQGSVLPLTIFYIVANVGISITALLLVQKTSASTTVLANVVALPLAALLFCLPLPSLERQVFHWRLAASLALVVIGNLLYSHRSLKS